MDDIEIDRTLRATLSENPSPEFVARVRTTLAGAPRPSFVGGWLKPAAAIACAAAVMIAVWLPREKVPAEAGLSAVAREMPTSLGETRRSLGAGGKPSNIPPTASLVAPTLRSAKSTKPARARAIAPDPPLPEVIIADDDVEAVRQFVSGARDRRFVATFEEAPIPTAWVMNDLAIAPITVEPLDSTQSHNN
jgi:hypothetical protein